MSKIHFIGGEKGGVGKSVVSRALAQYYLDHQIPFMGFDSDRSHGSLLRFYQPFTSPVLMDRFESLDAVVEAAAQDYERRVLIDLAAQTHAPLVYWMEESDLLEVTAEAGIQLDYWHVMDSGKDSSDLLGKLLDRFGNKLRYVIVLNEVRGSDFSILEQSGEKEKAQSLNAQFITIPRMDESTMTRIDATSSNFWSAVQPNDEILKLGLVGRQRVKSWLKKVYGEFARIEA